MNISHVEGFISTISIFNMGGCVVTAMIKKLESWTPNVRVVCITDATANMDTNVVNGLLNSPILSICEVILKMHLI